MRKDIEPRGMVPVLGSRQHLSAQEDLERIGNLRKFVPEKCGELFTRQQCARVAGKKDQQVQVRAVAQYAYLGDDPANFFIIHRPLRSHAARWAVRMNVIRTRQPTSQRFRTAGTPEYCKRCAVGAASDRNPPYARPGPANRRV
jgi:hypothetical protein